MKIIKSKNKKAKHEYFLSDELECGIVLQGFEIKTVQAGGIDLTGSYVKIIDNEVFLLNATLSEVNFNKFFVKHKLDNYPIIKETYEIAKRPKKLLLHKKQIKKFNKKLEPGYTLIVTEVYANENNKIKCTLALAKGKNNRDKRESIKERDVERYG
jgi:SsrA-binding protein